MIRLGTNVPNGGLLDAVIDIDLASTAYVTNYRTQSVRTQAKIQAVGPVDAGEIIEFDDNGMTPGPSAKTTFLGDQVSEFIALSGLDNVGNCPDRRDRDEKAPLAVVLTTGFLPSVKRLFQNLGLVTLGCILLSRRGDNSVTEGLLFAKSIFLMPLARTGNPR